MNKLIKNWSYPRHIMMALVGLLAISIGSSAGFAQSDDDVNAIIKELAPIAGQPKSSDAPVIIEKRPVIIQGRSIYVNPRRHVELEIYFDFDSAEITPRAERQLRSLGIALESDELRTYHYLIAGHTDAVGSDEYNLDLSERRAVAVYHYLIDHFAIDPDRLMTVGFGFRRLKDKHNPTAAINRRTEVILIVDE